MIIIFKEEPLNEIVDIYPKEDNPIIISEDDNFFEVGYDYYNEEDTKFEDASCFYDKDIYCYLEVVDSKFLSSLIKRIDYNCEDKYLFLKSADYLLRSYPDIYENETKKFLLDIKIQIDIEKIQTDINYYKNGISGRCPYHIPSIDMLHLNLEKISTIDIKQALILLEIELESLKTKQKLIIEKRKSGEYTYAI